MSSRAREGGRTVGTVTLKIKMTKTAGKDLDALDPAVRSLFLTRIREELPVAMSTDQTLTLTDGTEVRIHVLDRNGPVALYRMFDVDDDGEEEAVILTILAPDVVSTLTEPSTLTKSLIEDASLTDIIPSSSSFRVARDLISKIKTAES